MSELAARDVLADLFGSGDFPPEILPDTAHAADVVIQRLLDAGFEIKPAKDRDHPGASGHRSAPGLVSRLHAGARPCVRADRPAPDSPQKLDSPAGFPESPGGGPSLPKN